MSQKWSKSRAKELLRRHQARCVNVSLGDYGADSRKVATGQSLGSLLDQVTLYGTAPWLDQLGVAADPHRTLHLQRVKSFLGLQTARKYTCQKTGRARCARVLAPKRNLTSLSLNLITYNLILRKCLDLNSPSGRRSRLEDDAGLSGRLRIEGLG